MENMKIPCVVCGSFDAEIIKRYTEPDVYEAKVGILPDGYYRCWVRCNSCSMFRSEFSRDPEILHTIYEKQYRETGTQWRQNGVEELFLRIIAIDPAQSETHFRVNWLFNSLEMLRTASLYQFATSATLLDVGGASGVFAYAMKEKGFQAHVIDPSQDGAFMEKYGIGYTQGYFGKRDLDQQYDVISFLYVLEHLANPAEILADCKPRLKKGGVLFFELPDATAFHLCATDHDAFNACHLWLFGSRQITQLLHQQGFSLLAMQRYVTVRGYPSMMLIAGHTEEIDG